MHAVGSEFTDCLVETRDRVLIVTINRPQSRNALTPHAHDELAAVWDAYAADDGLWAAILTGAGEHAFCAGHDLKLQASGAPRRFAANGTGFGGLTERYDLDKPIIAALNGPALGGGFELALACDLIVADERAYVALPEPRVGLAALAGGLHRLPRQIGLKPALGMILTGRRVPAAEARQLGIVNEVAAAGRVLDAALEWARQIVECSPMSIRASKQVVYGQLDIAAYREAYAEVFPAVTAMRRSADYAEGPRAFVEKRAPRWQGR